MRGGTPGFTPVSLPLFPFAHPNSKFRVGRSRIMQTSETDEIACLAMSDHKSQIRTIGDRGKPLTPDGLER